MSIKRCFTLKDKSTIKMTLNKGKCHQKNGMVLKYFPADFGGVLIFIKKKQIKQAVKRNRIKRIVLNTYRELRPLGLMHHNAIIFFKSLPSLEEIRPLSVSLFQKIIANHKKTFSDA
jgi:ribonuclease P protein component